MIYWYFIAGGSKDDSKLSWYLSKVTLAMEDFAHAAEPLHNTAWAQYQLSEPGQLETWQQKTGHCCAVGSSLVSPKGFLEEATRCPSEQCSSWLSTAWPQPGHRRVYSWERRVTIPKTSHCCVPEGCVTVVHPLFLYHVPSLLSLLKTPQQVFEFYTKGHMWFKTGARQSVTAN